MDRLIASIGRFAETFSTKFADGFREVAGRGITANVVAPGYVETELTGVLPEKIKEQILDQVPVGRFGEPEEIAEVVAFLAGERAAYVTGQTIAVDGGMVMQ